MGFDPLTADGESDELARLRREEPVTRAPSGPWYFARFDDVLAATKAVDTFNASFREPGVVVPDEEQFINEIPEPRHGKIRRIINSAIAQHRIGRVEGYCTDLCNELLDDVFAGATGSGGTGSGVATVDLMHDYVIPVPNNVIAHLLGAPPADYRLWAEWSDEVVTGTYPTLYRNERGEGMEGAHPEFTAYIDAAIAERRARPRDDFMTRLLETEVDGRRLTDVEARTQLVFLFISGNETTRNLIGNLLWMLASDPVLFEALQRRPRAHPERGGGVPAPRPAGAVPHADVHGRDRGGGRRDLPARQGRVRDRVREPRRDRLRRPARVPPRPPRPAQPPRLRRRSPRVPGRDARPAGGACRGQRVPRPRRERPHRRRPGLRERPRVLGPRAAPAPGRARAPARRGGQRNGVSGGLTAG